MKEFVINKLKEFSAQEKKKFILLPIIIAVFLCVLLYSFNIDDSLNKEKINGANENLTMPIPNQIELSNRKSNVSKQLLKDRNKKEKANKKDFFSIYNEKYEASVNKENLTVNNDPYKKGDQEFIKKVKEQLLKIESEQNKKKSTFVATPKKQRIYIPKKTKEIEKPKKIAPKKELTFEQKLILSRKENIESTILKKKLNQVEFLAVINGNQTAYNNAMITVRVLNDVSHNNNILKRNTYLYGVAKIISTGRVKISFSSMTQNNKRVSIKLTAYDQLDGYEGLIINDEVVLRLLKVKTDDQVNAEIATYGKIGKIVSSVFRKKQKQAKINLYDEHTIILKGSL
ncbi:conjugative transposon protein TraM [Tenacibaculum finnmarkense]|uniref:conjugative transposon protein TraM n=1 Tax=Tenacibaculum finnmarkense TaxID=2781243 RepID=UPI001E378240|nr:conjugative transposon protein TraM [Tenacibaculum finnmarkense]MCD8401292.1 conjugative transposon protein TraM [Tenacibaculum finnmarkense genomovar ulcerans]